MVIKYADKEIEALDKKLNNPTGKIICPRCGKQLLFIEHQSSCTVKCETEGCLEGTVRGI